MATASAPDAVDYEVVIGLEVHSQLLTASKMFCRCDANYANAAPNSHVCPVCMGFPGVLPVTNRKAIDFTIMTALALNCEIPEYSKFDRKNYFYPDLPKGYQISQYDRPLSRAGYLTIRLDGHEKRIGITRVHLEEDTGRNVHKHEFGESYTLVDLNRAGVPLMEIVSEPDIRSPEEARLYVEKLRQILVYLGVSSGKMEEAALRCDANISVRPRGQQELGTKTEIKNMNSFRAVERALAYEAQRQIEELRAGGRIQQQTRGELRRLLNAAGLDVAASRVSPSGLAELLDLMADGTISGKQAKDVLEKAFASAETPGTVVAREGIAQLSDAGELELIVEEVIAENPKAVEDYRAGKTASVQFLIGQVMKRTKGRAKPDILNPLVLGKLDQA